MKTKTDSEIPVLICPLDEAVVAERMRRREALSDPRLISDVQVVFAQVKADGDRAVPAPRDRRVRSGSGWHRGGHGDGRHVRRETVVGIGPTDCAVLADDTADAHRVARDLASEAEHGPDAASLLATTCEPFARRLAGHLADIIAATEAPRRENLKRVANYAIGITAVLPTNGAARALSGVTARDMLRMMTSASSAQRRSRPLARP